MMIDRPSSFRPAILGFTTVFIIAAVLIAIAAGNGRFQNKPATSAADETEVVSIEPNARKAALCGAAATAETIKTSSGRELVICIDNQTRVVTLPATLVQTKAK